jgi:Rod binding domain-containing protein
MASAITPSVGSEAITALAKSDPKAAERIAKARSVAEDFEAVFLNSMFQQMFANIGQGPFSGGPGAGVWRSFLTDEYAKSFVKAGGIGIADQLQRELLAQQELR